MRSDMERESGHANANRPYSSQDWLLSVSFCRRVFWLLNWMKMCQGNANAVHLLGKEWTGSRHIYSAQYAIRHKWKCSRPQKSDTTLTPQNSNGAEWSLRYLPWSFGWCNMKRPMWLVAMLATQVRRAVKSAVPRWDVLHIQYVVLWLKPKSRY